MKKILGLFLALTLLSQSAFALNCQPNSKFMQVIYLSGTATGGTGLSPSSPKPFVDGDLWVIPAETVIEKVMFCIDVAITGTTVLEVGDDDDADGFVTDQGGNFATPGCYSLDARNAGAYMRLLTNGATNANDVDVVARAKYYSATGKEVKLNITTTNTAGKARVILEGMCLRAGT